jgi:hypothetical protein
MPRSSNAPKPGMSPALQLRLRTVHARCVKRVMDRGTAFLMTFSETQVKALARGRVTLAVRGACLKALR